MVLIGSPTVTKLFISIVFITPLVEVFFDWSGHRSIIDLTGIFNNTGGPGRGSVTGALACRSGACDWPTAGSGG